MMLMHDSLSKYELDRVFCEDYLKRKCTTCNNFWNKRKYEIGETTCVGLRTHTYRGFYYDYSVNEVIEILKKCQKDAKK